MSIMIFQELMGISCVVIDVVYCTVEGKETLHEEKKKPFSNSKETSIFKPYFPSVIQCQKSTD